MPWKNTNLLRLFFLSSLLLKYVNFSQARLRFHLSFKRGHHSHLHQESSTFPSVDILAGIDNPRDRNPSLASLYCKQRRRKKAPEVRTDET